MLNDSFIINMGGNDENSVRNDAADALLNMQNVNNQQPPNIPTNMDPMQQLSQAMAALMESTRAIQNSMASGQQQQVYNVLLDISHNIKDFDGIEGHAAARAWIKQLESTAVLHRWTEAIAFKTARGHLIKAARDWYLANIDVIKNWSEFRKAFGDTFLVQKSLTEKWKEMEERVQKSGENTTEYFFSKLKLCKVLGFSLQEIKSQVAIGLWSREVSNAIMAAPVSNENELLQTILNLEKMNMSRKERIEKSKTTNGDFQKKGAHDTRSNAQKHYRYSSSTPYSGTKPVGEKEKNNSAPPSEGGNVTGESTTDRRDVECYRCHKKGHLARNCSVVREVKCYNCNEVGHVSKHCDKPRKTEKS